MNGKQKIIKFNRQPIENAKAKIANSNIFFEKK